MTRLMRIIEWFWRSRALERAADVSGEDAKTVRASLAATDQRAAAAELLWVHGHAKEATRIARENFESTSAQYGDRMEASGATPQELRLLEQARAFLTEGPVQPEPDRVYITLAKARRAIAQRVRSASSGTLTVLSQRVTRILGAVALLSAAGLVTHWALTRPPELRVRASGHYPGPYYHASDAVDGDTTTEWLLPNRSTGWIAVSLPGGQRVSSVHVLNGRNPGYGDRAIRRFRIELRRGEEIVESEEGSFESIETNPEWLDVDIAGEDITEIRLVVLGYHQTGAALAELSWTE